MGGDYTRFTFTPKSDYAGVLMQQGRVLIDADWNEFVELLDRRLRAETMDIIGRCVVPRERPGIVPTGFQILVSGGNFTIGRGRAYVDGLLAENHGSTPAGVVPEFDRALAEERGTQPLPYNDQPYLPDAPALPGGGPHLVYLDVWRREVTPLQDPNLVEKAVGVDTATRAQTVWQVKLLENVGPAATCGMDITRWDELTRPSAARLTTGVVAGPESTDPCVIAPGGGYRGTENRLYRVEIHNPGAAGGAGATFKWSRDNGSVASNVTAINAARDQITVKRTGRDAVLRFGLGDWVEVTDDRRELKGLPGEIRKITADPDQVNQTLTLSAPPLPADFNPADPDRHTRVVRWDQRGQVLDTNGNQVVNLDQAGSTGLIPVTGAAVTVVLEDGVTVRFGVEPAGGRFRTGDYWVFAARTVDASVQPLNAAPPRGIHHHFCRLALVTFPGAATDCRTFWPPDFPQPSEGKSCDCTVCVSADDHNSGRLTIQQAVNNVKTAGGKVCLEPGIYNLSETPVIIDGAHAVQLVGHRSKTMLVYTGSASALVVRGSADVTVEKMLVYSAGGALSVETSLGVIAQDLVLITGGGRVRNLPSVLLLNCLLPTIQRSFVLNFGGVTSVAVGLEGIVAGALIRENVMLAGTGVGTAAGPASDQLGRFTTPLTFTNAAAGQTPQPSLTAFLTIEDNLMQCAVAGVNLGIMSINFGETRISGNFINGCAGTGIAAMGVLLSALFQGSRLDICGNVVRASRTGTGIVVATDETRISGNDIWGEQVGQGSDGILLVENPFLNASAAAAKVEEGVDHCLIVNNRIAGIAGRGIHVAAGVRLRSAMIKQNLIDGAGQGGIVMEAGGAGDLKIAAFAENLGTDSSADSLKIENNQILNVAAQTLATGVVAAGILVNRAARAEVVGNILTRFGQGAANGGCVGVAALSSESVRIAGNTLTEIGPPEFTNNCVGIAVQGRFRELDVNDNLVRRNREPRNLLRTSTWFALRVDGESATAGGDAAGFPSGRETMAVRGNVFESYGGSQAILITTGGVCVFGENRCVINVPLGIVPAEINAGAAIVSGNYLEGPNGLQNRHLPVLRVILPVAKTPPVTVLGNIANGRIFISDNTTDNDLQAPWLPLNVFLV